MARASQGRHHGGNLVVDIIPVQAIVGAMNTHNELATKPLSDETTRGLFLDVVYELLKREAPGGLFDAARATPT